MAATRSSSTLARMARASAFVVGIASLLIEAREVEDPGALGLGCRVERRGSGVDGVTGGCGEGAWTAGLFAGAVAVGVGRIG